MPEIILTLENLSQLTGKSLEELTTAITNEAGDGIDPAKALSVLTGSFQSKLKAKGEEQYQKAWKASRQAVETAIKEQFGINEFDSAEGAITAAAQMLLDARKAGTGKLDPEKLTIEQLSTLPQFTAATKQLKEALEAAQKEKQAAEAAFEGYKVMQTARASADTFLTDKKAHYGAAGKDRAMQILFSEMQAAGYQLSLDDTGAIQVLTTDGKPATDALHNPVTFNATIEKLWPFGFNQAPGGGNPNPPNPGDPTQGKYAGYSVEQLQKLAADPRLDTAELKNVLEAISRVK